MLVMTSKDKPNKKLSRVDSNGMGTPRIHGVSAFHYVYVLQNDSKSWYTGYTSDLRKRLMEHNTGKSNYTKSRGPFTLIYYEACLSIHDAYRREQYLKTGMGKRFLKNRVKSFSEGVLTG